MRITVPISHHDAHGGPRFADCIEAYGGLEDHSILIIPAPSVIDDARILHERLSPLAKACEIHILNEEPMGDWPVAPNHHWAMATEIIGVRKDVMPWLWMELDTFPTQDNWANKISNAFLNAGRARVMGFVRPLPYVDPRTGMPRIVPGDTYMLGVAVYDHHIGIIGSDTYIPDIQSLKSANGMDRTDGKPFDVYLRHAFQRLGRAHTDLIADQWQTHNYRIENGQLLCDSLTSERIKFPRGGIVEPNAVLIHGCKDDSGFILSAEHAIPIPVRAAVNAATYTASGATREENPLVILMAQMQLQQQQMAERQAKQDERLLALMERLVPKEPSETEKRAIRLRDFGPEKADDQPAPQDTISALDEALGSNGPDGAEGNAGPVIYRIKSFLAGKSKRLSDISEALGLSQEEVLEAISAEGSGVAKPAGPAQWLRELEPT